MNSYLAMGLALVVLWQTPSATPIRIGTNADRLTERDIAALLALPGVANPWLIIASPTLVSVPGDNIRIHLPSTTVTSNLRRGTLIVAMRDRTALPGDWKQTTEKFSYAQVGIEGRSMDLMEKTGDITQPFMVIGSFTDEELLSLVRFIRSKPAGTSYAGRSISVAGDLPIGNVSRPYPNSVTVHLRRSDSESQQVMVELDGKKWTVVYAAWGIA